ncbi:hypothetical protein V2J09_003443 [Rumex salicifolius]
MTTLTKHLSSALGHSLVVSSSSCSFDCAVFIIAKMSKQGPPKHQNTYAWKPKAGIKINETEPGGRLRPLSEITGVCQRCRDQIDWKRKYGKYKPLSEPSKCQKCSKRTVRQAYHSLCTGCSKEHKLCAKCCCRVGQTVGRDITEVEAEKKMLEEAIKNARERERRSLLRAMNKGKPKEPEEPQACQDGNIPDLFPVSSLEEYAELSRDDDEDGSGCQNDKDLKICS